MVEVYSGLDLEVSMGFEVVRGLWTRFLRLFDKLVLFITAYYIIYNFIPT